MGLAYVPTFQEFSNIPLEHTPDAQPTFYEGILSIWGFGDAWGMLQGYVRVLLDALIPSKINHACTACR